MTRSSSLVFTLAGVVALGATLPALGQKKPESLLPPGFEQAPPPPPAATPAPPPSAPSGGSTPAQPSSARPRSQGSGASTARVSQSDTAGKADETPLEEREIHYDVPPTARRSLKLVGVFSEQSGGFPATAYGVSPGPYLMAVAHNTRGPLVSRWATIMMRRLLMSKTASPDGVNAADWVARRSWILLRMGDAAGARELIQQVDSGNFSDLLLRVAMPVYLGNADLSGMCPLAEMAADETEMPSWLAARAICASLAGEQGQATSLLNRTASRKWMTGIDYLLTEKAVGAGTNGRRNVKIEWEKVSKLNAWRHGLSQAVGIEPPEKLYATMGRHVDGWRAQLPMLSSKTKLSVAKGSAALGVLSNREMVGIYGQALDDADLADNAKADPEALAEAYTAKNDGNRISALKRLWSAAKTDAEKQGTYVLTARVAALIAPDASNSGSADEIVASMLSAGFDRQGQLWADKVKQGSVAWAMLATGAPDWTSEVQPGAIGDFKSNNRSENDHRTALLLAGLGGMGRVSNETLSDVSSDLGVNLVDENDWSRSMDAAAARGESGTVALLAASALYGDNWAAIQPRLLYHIVKALRTVGLEAEARMIAAEAVGFG